jgi:transcriptional regulator with XRE-family HTH domain
MFSKEIFGQRLKECRKEAGETQAQLGELLAFYKSRISEIESGNSMATLDKVALICEHYNISADYLLGLTDEPKPYKRKKPNKNLP